MIGLATTAYSSGINSMCAEFGVSTLLGQLGLFTFNFTCALAPMFLAPFCELVGRKIIYVGAYACFIIMFIGLALGQNIATIIVCRALLGKSMFRDDSVLPADTIRSLWLRRHYPGRGDTGRHLQAQSKSNRDGHLFLGCYPRHGRSAHLQRLHRPKYWLEVD